MHELARLYLFPRFNRGRSYRMETFAMRKNERFIINTAAMTKSEQLLTCRRQQIRHSARARASSPPPMIQQYRMKIMRQNSVLDYVRDQRGTRSRFWKLVPRRMTSPAAPLIDTPLIPTDSFGVWTPLCLSHPRWYLFGRALGRVLRGFCDSRKTKVCGSIVGPHRRIDEIPSRAHVQPTSARGGV